MAKKSKQTETYQKRVEIKHILSVMSFKEDQLTYLKNFIYKYRKAFISLFLLVFVQVLLEIALLIWGKSYIHKLVVLLEREVLITALLSLVIVLSVYAVSSYFSLKASKQLLVDFINKLRHDWFTSYLEKFSEKANPDRKIRLLTKVTYHFSLVQMGFSQAVSNSLYLVVTLFILLAAMPTFAPHAMKFIPLFIIFYGILIFLGYKVSHKYISKEQTLSTSIISHIAKSIYDIDLIKQHKWEADSVKTLQDLVELDTYFRVRRSVWMALGRKILFGVIILLFAMIQIGKLYFPEFILTETSSDIVATGIIVVILTRLAYMSLSIGLYFAPLKIGLILTLPEKETHLSPHKFQDFTQYHIHANKTKLLQSGEYYKNIEFNFGVGERILFTGDSYKELRNLARILSAEESINNSSWVLKLDNERYLHNTWSKQLNITYHVKPEFNSIATIGEVITGRDRSQLNTTTIDDIFSKLSKLTEYKFLFDLNKKLGTTYNHSELNFVETALLQLAHCLIAKPQVVILDPIWASVNNPGINKMIQLINEELKNSIIINFTDDKIIKYTQSYKLANGKVNENA